MTSAHARRTGSAAGRGRSEDRDIGEAGTTPDPWGLLGLPGQLLVAKYLSVDNAAQYRVIVDVLLEQQQHTLTGVPHAELADLVADRIARLPHTSPESAARLLSEDVFDLEERMRRLYKWGVVDMWEDRVRADEDFHRHLARYQLTDLAAKLHRAVVTLGHDDTTAVAATLAPPILANQLTRAHTHLGSDADEVAQALATVQSTVTMMATAAGGWQAKLAGALAGTPDETKLQLLRDTLTRYLDMWGAGVDTYSGQIVDLTRRLAAADDDAWRPAALRTLGPDADDSRLATHIAGYRDTLATVAAWFDGPTSQARVLRRQMRDTIAPMVRGQRTLAAVGGHVSRRVELLNLAGALEATASDDDAWSLWCRATGLFGARHLGHRAPMPTGQPQLQSWWDTPPIEVPTRLRRQGPRATTGRPARLPDRRAGKVAARAAAARARAQLAEDRARLLARSGTLLSQWDNASEHEVAALIEFLTLLEATPAAADGTKETITADGLLRLRSEPVRPHETTPAASKGTATAVVHGVAGRLVVTDQRLHLSAVKTR